MSQVWGPGNLELFALCMPPTDPKDKGGLQQAHVPANADLPIAIDEQFFVIPFAKSAVTSLHTPVRAFSLVPGAMS